MSKTTNKFSPEVRERAVRLVLDNEAQYPSRWQAVMSIAAKIGCTPQTLNDWVKKAEVDSGGRVADVVGIGGRRNLRVSRSTDRRLLPPRRSRHEGRYRRLVIRATDQRQRA
jgi:transposase-like protein